MAAAAHRLRAALSAQRVAAGTQHAELHGVDLHGAGLHGVDLHRIPVLCVHQRIFVFRYRKRVTVFSGGIRARLVRFVPELLVERTIMIATRNEPKPAETLNKEIVSELVHAPGPCVTLLLPPYRPGAGKAPAALLKTALHDAAKELADRKISDQVSNDLLEPLRQWSHEEDSLAGSASTRVIFRSTGLLHQFELPVPPFHVRACTVGGCFGSVPF